MSGATEIDLRELRDALDRVLEAAAAKFGATIDLGGDHYWTVAPKAAFDVTAEVPDPTVGQLSDDVQEIRRLITDRDPVSVWHDLAHIIGVLNRLAAMDLPAEASALEARAALPQAQQPTRKQGVGITVVAWCCDAPSPE
jgi:hypothetical protein